MRGTYLRVGVLVLAGLALLVAAVLFLGGNQIAHGRPYETYFRDSVQGLDVGAPVKYRGVTIGAVTQIGLSGAEYGRGAPDEIRRATFRTVFVRFEIDMSRVGQPPGEAQVEEGLRTRIAPQGLTGQSYIELDFANAQRFPVLEVPWRPRYTYLPSMPSTLSQVQDAATVLLGKIQQVDIDGLAAGVLGLVTDLRGTLKDGDGHALLVQATATLEGGADRAGGGGRAGVVRGVAADPGVRPGPWRRGRRRATCCARRRRRPTSWRWRRRELPQLIASLDAVSRRADTGSADLEAGLVPLLRDARTAVSSLRQASEDLRRDPGQVVLGGAPPRSRDR